jgi:hypothetical protein
MSTHKYQAEAADLPTMEAQGPGPREPELVAAIDNYELVKMAVLETPRGRWFLAEHARRERADERMMLMASIKKLERVAQDNLDALRLSAIAENVGRKIDNVLRLLPPDGSLTPEEQRLVEQRLIEPRPFIRK